MDTIRKLIRKTRIESKMSQTDLAEGVLGLSQPKLSRYEKGIITLDDLEIDGLLNRLEIDRRDIPDLIKEIEHKERVSFFSLRALETMIRKRYYAKDKFRDQIKEKFKELENHISNPLAVTYAKAKIHFMKNDLDKAEKKYLEIVNSNEEDQFLSENLISGSYLNLSAIAYKQNDLARAFQYCDKGLEHFDPKGERAYLCYSLIYNKALFFFKIGDMELAEKTLEPAWKDRMLINDDMRTRIQVYALKASIKRERQMYDESINILNKAVDLAAINDLTDMSFELSIDLARHCYENGYYELSGTCFKSALLFRSDLDNPNDASVYIEIAKYHLTRKYYDKAESEIDKAVIAAKRHNDMYKLTKALIVKGRIDTSIGLYCPKSHFDEALSLSKKYGYKQLEHEILTHLIELNPNTDQQIEFSMQKETLEKELRGG